MALEINRREFLRGLLSVGLLLPTVEVSDAILPQELDEAWNKLREEPTEFEVDEYGTITAHTEDKVVSRWDIYDLTERDFSSADDLSAIAELHQPVIWAIDRFYTDLKEQLENEDFDYGEGLVEGLRRKLEEAGGDFLSETISSLSVSAIPRWRRHEWPSDIDGIEAVEALLRLLSPEEFSALREHLKKWAGDEPDWSAESDYFANPPDGQGQAFQFFSKYVDQELLDALGIKIVEGEHPGSTYYAAELKLSPEEASRLAEDAGIPMRFVRAIS